jgi:hypothetical protein
MRPLNVRQFLVKLVAEFAVERVAYGRYRERTAPVSLWELQQKMRRRARTTVDRSH